MVHPYVAEHNFEAGTNAEFTSEVDTESKLNIDHYTVLARNGARLEVPYAGAYAAHIDLSLGTADAYLQETALYDMVAGDRRLLRLMFYAKGLTMAASDRFTILALQSAGPVDEMTLSILNNAGRLQLVAAETGATAVASGRVADLIQEQWHTLELLINIDTGATDGSMTFFLDGYQIGTELTGLGQGAITQARIGAMGIDAGTTAGHLLFDSIIVDDTRVFPPATRFSATRVLTKSGHAFLGPGQIESVALIAGAGTDSVLTCYDTDEANTNTPMIVPELRNADGGLDPVVYLAWHGAGYFKRGCYIVLSGTEPRAHITARRATSLSVGAIKSYVRDRPGHGVV